MKGFFCFLAILLVGSQVLHAVDYTKKDAATSAAENLKFAKQLREEAQSHEKYAEKAGGSDAALLEKFVKLTLEEAKWLQMSGEAFEKNQLRLGERYQEKARELCEQRGKLGEKVAAVYKKDEVDSKNAATAEKCCDAEKVKP